MNENNAILNLKSQFADAMLEMTKEKQKLLLQAEEYRNVIVGIIDLVGLKDPSIEQLLTKIQSLVVNNNDKKDNDEQEN